MGLFLGDSEPSKIFVGDTQISKVFLGDTQVRPSGGGGGLPSAYQEVEYIENTSAGPWIDLGHIPTSNTMGQIKFMNIVQTGYVIYGYYAGDDYSDYRLFNASNQIYFDIGNPRINGNTLGQNIDYEWEIGNFYVKDIPTQTTLIYGSFVSSYTGTHNMTLNHSYADSANSCNRWYYVKIYENNVLIRDMIPCYRKSDTEIGMYDIVNDVFYTNVGSGAFTKGPNVGPGGGWQPGVNTLAYYKFNGDLLDSSGNWKNFSGTPYGYTTGVEGSALQNYTPGSAADLTASVAPLGGAFALAFWISLNNSQTLQRIFVFGDSSTTDMQFEFYNDFSGFQIYNNANATRLAFPFTQPSVGDWHSFVITGDGVNQVEVYIDGTQVSPHSSYNPTFWYPSNSNIRIGVYGYGSYDNSIDELVIEDKYWTQSDVDAYLANYN